jgi:hypothetical protein
MRCVLAVCGACGLLLALAATPASAATLFVDEAGDDQSGANTCQSTAPACKTIGQAISKLTSAPDNIQVDSGVFNENVSLPRGDSLRFVGWDANNAEPAPTIDGGTATAITVTATSEPTIGAISGFTILGDANSMVVSDSVNVSFDRFFETTPASDPLSPTSLLITGGTVSVSDSTFTDPTPTDEQWGAVAQGGSPTFTNNSFTGYRIALEVGTPTTIDSNSFTGLHESSSLPMGFGIDVAGTSATIAHNTISAPGAGDTTGISIVGSGEVADDNSAVGGNLSRNFIHDQTVGVESKNTGAPVTLDNDVIVNNSGKGITSVDDNDLVNQSDLTATHETIYGNGTDVTLKSADLTLRSSAIEDTIDATDASCAISFSRGPTTGAGCAGFQTAAAPLFANPVADDYHLTQPSPLIDAGDPGAIGGTLDIDGDPRVLDGDCVGGPRRDMGADEFVRSDCTPPDTTIDSGPSGTTADTTPTFGFSATEGGSTFECALDGGAFGACSGAGATHTTAVLAEGPHTFSVRATDPAGNTDASPAEQTFTVDIPDPPPPPRDTDPPDTSIKKGPKGRSTDQTPTFRFGSDEAGVTFRCRMDKQKFTRCGRKVTIRVGLGKHVMRVYAVDEAGNRDRTPAKRAFVITD